MNTFAARATNVILRRQTSSEMKARVKGQFRVRLVWVLTPVQTRAGAFRHREGLASATPPPLLYFVMDGPSLSQTPESQEQPQTRVYLCAFETAPTLDLELEPQAPWDRDMATADNLPDDVLHHVFALMLTNRNRSDPYNLSTASLVCRRWRVPAQRALAMDVTFLSFLHPQRADKSIASPLRSRYQIRSLEIQGDLAMMARVLACCPGLHLLRIWGGPHLDWSVLADGNLGGDLHSLWRVMPEC